MGKTSNSNKNGSQNLDYIEIVRKDKKRPPLLTLCLVVANIVVFYKVGSARNEPEGRFFSAHCVVPNYLGPVHDLGDWSNECYGPNATAVWARCVVASFFHNNPPHLWGNMASSLLIGTILEYTEGRLHLACIVWGAATLGYAMFGVVKGDAFVYAAGFSGALYGMMFSLFSLLALNWAEMPLRWLRLGLNLMAFGEQLYQFNNPLSRTAFAVHGFGALAGISVSLVLARNVRLNSWELYFVWFGVVLFLAMVVVALVDGQMAPALLSLPVLVLMVFYAIRITKRVRTAASSSAPLATDNFDDEVEIIAHEVESDIVNHAKWIQDTVRKSNKVVPKPDLETVEKRPAPYVGNKSRRGEAEPKVAKATIPREKMTKEERRARKAECIERRAQRKAKRARKAERARKREEKAKRALSASDAAADAV